MIFFFIPLKLPKMHGLWCVLDRNVHLMFASWADVLTARPQYHCFCAYLTEVYFKKDNLLLKLYTAT